MIYMLAFIPLVIPATHVFEKIGLRWTVVSSTFITCLGSWIKVFSASPDRFYLAFVGQTLAATMQTCVLSSPSRLAAQWFHSEQVSTASSLGVFGTLTGIALGFLIPPMVVKNHVNLEEVGNEIQNLYYLYAGITTAIAFFVFIFFQDEPKLPPTETRALLKLNRIENKEGFIQPIKRLSRNKCFLLLCNSYGMNIGVLNAVATLLNQIFLMHFPGGEEDAGRIGLLIILTGMVGSVIFGVIIDKTHKFKETTVIIYFLTLCGQIIFAFSVYFEVQWMVYAASIFLGFFMSGYFALGYELCAEYTYPEPEFITSGILNVANNVYGIAFILLFGKLMEVYGDLAAHIGFCSALLVGFVTTILTKDEQRRENVRKAAKYKDIPLKEENFIKSVL
ncbi:feline leukemia virus subgroup C receptor-related protein 2-like isoform X2 [Belonocnema kinseyi]|nr:feline leukemia virus subgroup C receptor-related protein 2-like isoform X2 [Belonocnema kinseyi]XP_033214530.1 feline leukemia virus subgroup C receptor-related protein 2-like isoform X2 [Belonocnema kinseyi]